MNSKREILFITVLTLLFPLMKVKFGSIPLYFIDVMMLYLIVKHGFSSLTKFHNVKFIFVYFFFSVISFIVEFLTYNSIVSIYFSIRYLLPFYFIFFFAKRLKTEEEIQYLLKLLVICSAINSLLCILYTLPFTRFLVEPLYGSEFFYPQKEKFVGEIYSEASQRGITLSGSANSTAFLCLIGLCSLIYLKFIKKIKQNSLLITNNVVFVGIVILIVGATLSSLSRSAIITLAMFFFFLLFATRIEKIKGYLIFTLILLSIIFTSSSLLDQVDYSRIVKSTEILSGEEGLGHSEMERIDAYTEPVNMLVRHPIIFIMGKGVSTKKISKSKIPKFYGEEIKGRHGLLGAIVYDRGFIAFFAFFFFIAVSYYFVFFKSKSRYNQFNKMILVVIFMPLVVTHLFIDNNNGFYHFMFLISIVYQLEGKLSNNLNTIYENNSMYNIKE